jgi:hypothetical protein
MLLFVSRFKVFRTRKGGEKIQLVSVFDKCTLSAYEKIFLPHFLVVFHEKKKAAAAAT